MQCSGIGPERRLGHSAVLVYGQVMFCLGRITGGRKGWGGGGGAREEKMP